MREGKHTEVHYEFVPEGLPEAVEDFPVIPFPETAETVPSGENLAQERASFRAVAALNVETAPDPSDQPLPEVLAGCCEHSSTSANTRRRFKAALKKLGVAVGVMHDSCFGLMNHLDSGEEYRWQGGRVQRFDRDAYVWNEVEVK